MLFNSLIFLAFAPTFLISFFLTSGRTRVWLCLSASYVFYGWWDWRFLGLIGLSTLVDYLLGLRISSVDKHHGKRLVAWSCAFNLGLLAIFKYFGFFAESARLAAATIGIELSPITTELILPVGISFFTFQTMSYSIDLYRREVTVERSLLHFATFVAFFPQLVAGPIVRARDFLPELRSNAVFDWQRFLDGFRLILWGFCLKLILADSLAIVVDYRYDHIAIQTSLSMIIGTVAYSFQIYGDFCGYSLIAIGLGRIMGFDFGENFKRPYFSTSPSDFWKRWHISLSSWLRDYLYIPLGGNRGGKLATARNLMITMLLGGLWHGSGWGFILWGGVHGMYLVIHRLLSPFFKTLIRLSRTPDIVVRCLQILMMFTLVTMAWIPFRAQTFGDAISVFTQIVSFEDLSIAGVVQKYETLRGLLLIGMVVMIDAAISTWGQRQPFVRFPVLGALACAMMIWAMALIGNYSENAFIYFQF